MGKYKTENIRLACATANEMLKLADRLNQFGDADHKAYPLLKQADCTVAWENSATIYEKAFELIEEICEEFEQLENEHL